MGSLLLSQRKNRNAIGLYVYAIELQTEFWVRCEPFAKFITARIAKQNKEHRTFVRRSYAKNTELCLLIAGSHLLDELLLTLMHFVRRYIFYMLS